MAERTDTSDEKRHLRAIAEHLADALEIADRAGEYLVAAHISGAEDALQLRYRELGRSGRDYARSDPTGGAPEGIADDGA